MQLRNGSSGRSKHARTSCVAVAIVLCAGGLLRALPPQKPAPQAATIKACSLVTKEEVKKHLPWRPQLDSMPIEEEPIGATGSSCNYATVFVQIMPFSQGRLDGFKKIAGIEPVPGVGDEAYFHNNKNRYAEVVVKVGAHLLTLQANVDNNMGTIKPATVNLAKLYVTRLR